MNLEWNARTALVVSCLAAAWYGSGCALPITGGPALETVDRVEIERYMGTWYEIARYPNSFEQGCSAVTAEYTLREDGTVLVVNTCREADGVTVKSRIEGFAEVADGSTNAKLTVYFFYPFGAPYWIIDLDDEYQYAVVSEPTRSFLWILSRTPTLDPETYGAILSRLSEQGFDLQRLELVPQVFAEAP